MAESKVCTGPAHDQPVALPLTAKFWYFHKSGPRLGLPLARCRRCVNWNKLRKPPTSLPGRTDAKKVLPVLQELVVLSLNSIRTAAWEAGVSETTIRSILSGQHGTVQRSTSAKILAARDRRVRARLGFEEQARQEQRLLDLAGY